MENFFILRMIEGKTQSITSNTFLPFGILIFYHSIGCKKRREEEKFLVLSRTAERDNSKILVTLFPHFKFKTHNMTFFGGEQNFFFFVSEGDKGRKRQKEIEMIYVLSTLFTKVERKRSLGKFSLLFIEFLI